MNTSYYGRPVVKPHVWTPYIPLYFWIGGTMGAAAVHAVVQRARGNAELATVQRTVALAGALSAPVLLIADLGVPLRFYNMLRVFKPTSPMSVGSWALVAFGGTVSGATLADVAGMPKAARALEVAAALLGPVIATYTAVLIADTATPAWHEAYGELPFVFIASGVAGAGACGTLFASTAAARPARRLMIAGAIGMLLATRRLEGQLGGFLAEPYRTGRGGALKKTASVLSALGAAVAIVAGKNPGAAKCAAIAVAAAGIFERYAVLAAGTASACDPKYTVEPQRRRIDAARAAAAPA